MLAAGEEFRETASMRGIYQMAADLKTKELNEKKCGHLNECGATKRQGLPSPNCEQGCRMYIKKVHQVQNPRSWEYDLLWKGGLYRHG